MFVCVVFACLCSHLCVSLSILSAAVYTLCMSLSSYLRFRSCTLSLLLSVYVFLCSYCLSIFAFVCFEYSKLPPFWATKRLVLHVGVAWVMLTHRRENVTSLSQGTVEPLLADTLFSGHLLITDTNRGTD